VDLSHLTPRFGHHEFAIRRLHSLLGLMPLGAYLVFHLATNASVVDGVETYQRRADQIHVMGETTVQFIGWTLILLPILLHGLIGLMIVARGKRNLVNYPYRENFRYTLERATGVLVFLFVVWHVFHMTGWFPNEWWTEHVARPLGGAKFDPSHVMTGVEAVRASPWITTIYVAGTLAAVYHLANGLWTAGITWGVWTSAPAQRWANFPCLIVGAGLAVVGMATVVGMYRVDLPAQPRIAMGAGMVLVGLLIPYWPIARSGARGPEA
jgi:succinate dehydrogenase / fumarate reductase, cytochrome b subunit